MSQHDYVIDNQTFPNTRTDLNNALAAIASTNAGATAPSTTYAYQLWYDTTTDFIKMRNADNDAWITLFELDQANDTVSLPATSIQPNPSLIINGQMTVAQRGTSSTTSGYGSVDRWQNGYGGGTSTGSQESLTSSDTPYGLGFRNYFRLTNTSTASGTSDYRQMVQVIEAQNLANSGWNYTSASSYVTLSFWVRSSVAGKYGIVLVTGDTPNYQFSFTETLAANTWTKVTKTISGNSNLVFNNDNGAGLTIAIAAWMGSDYTDAGSTLDSWVAFDTSVYFPTDIVNWAGTSSATFDLTGVKLELGQTATDFIHQPYDEVLNQCLRYYQQSLGGGSRLIKSGYATATNLQFLTVDHMVTMNHNPDIVFSNTGASNMSTTVTLNVNGTKRFEVFGTQTVTGEGYFLFDYTADAEL